MCFYIVLSLEATIQTILVPHQATDFEWLVVCVFLCKTLFNPMSPAASNRTVFKYESH